MIILHKDDGCTSKVIFGKAEGIADGENAKGSNSCAFVLPSTAQPPLCMYVYTYTQVFMMMMILFKSPRMHYA